MHPPRRWINTIRNGLVSASKRTGKAKRIDPNVRLLFVSIFSNSFSLFFPPTRTWPISGTERTERPSSLRNTAADIIARSRIAGIIKRYVTKLMERMKKPCREYRPGKDTSSTSIVPRMLERVHSTFHAASTSNCVSRELKAIFSTIFNDLFRRDAAWT